MRVMIKINSAQLKLELELGLSLAIVNVKQCYIPSPRKKDLRKEMRYMKMNKSELVRKNYVKIMEKFLVFC